MLKWISVEDRLPEEGTLVIAAHLYEHEDIDTAVCWYINNSFHACEDALSAENYDGGATIYLDVEITHWASLPKLI